LPFIQTIFSPLTNARKLAGDRVLTDMKENPTLFKQALQVLTDTTINFVKANIEAGVDGFFFATQCATRQLLTEEEYKEFGEPFDLQVINAYKDITWFNVAHIHGEGGMFELIEKYPVNCLSWHDRWSGPSLSEARKITEKALLGGIREIPYFDQNKKKVRDSLLVAGSVLEVKNHIFEAISEVDGKGLLLGPGCVASQFSTETNLYAVRSAVAEYAAGKEIYPEKILA
jgi:uroporphyrinogen decarboxylase